MGCDGGAERLLHRDRRRWQPHEGMRAKFRGAFQVQRLGHLDMVLLAQVPRRCVACSYRMPEAASPIESCSPYPPYVLPSHPIMRRSGEAYRARRPRPPPWRSDGIRRLVSGTVRMLACRHKLTSTEQVPATQAGSKAPGPRHRPRRSRAAWPRLATKGSRRLRLLRVRGRTAVAVESPQA